MGVAWPFETLVSWYPTTSPHGFITQNTTTWIFFQVTMTSLWRWRQHCLSKRWYPIISLRGVIIQQTATWISTAVKTSYLSSALHLHSPWVYDFPLCERVNAHCLYSWCVGFQSGPKHRPFKLKIFVVFLVLSDSLPDALVFQDYYQPVVPSLLINTVLRLFSGTVSNANT